MTIFSVNDDSVGRWERLPSDLHKAAYNPNFPNLLPSSLRPKPSPPEEDPIPPSRVTGNVIVDVGHCEGNFNSAIRNHLKTFPTCEGDVVLDPESFSTWGLGIAVAMKCTECGFRTGQLKFYREQNVVKKRGRKPAAINTQLQVALTKQPLGNAGVREILAGVDVPGPAESGMQKIANTVSDAFHDISQNELRRNRIRVKNIMNIRRAHSTNKHDEGLPTVVAQSDAAYNNPIKGQRFYQPGTQVWAPCFPGEPGLHHIPIAFATRSKVCSCPPGQHKPDCKLTFPESQAMGNAEYHLGKDLARQLLKEDDSSLGVQTLVTDGDSSMQRGMREVMLTKGVKTKKGDCTRHVTRSIARNIRKANLSKQCLGEDRTAAQRAQNKATLANFVERRCAMEHRALAKKYGDNEEAMVAAAEPVVLSIMACIQGFHDVCHQGSLVCKAHRKKGQTKVSK